MSAGKAATSALCGRRGRRKAAFPIATFVLLGSYRVARAHKISTESHTIDEGFMSAFTRLVLIVCLLASTIQATDPVTLLQQRCAACHGESNGVSGLKINSRDNLLKGGKRGPAIIPGKSADSLLFRAVARLGDLKMPPNAPVPGEFIKSSGNRRLVQPATVLLPAIRSKAYR